MNTCSAKPPASTGGWPGCGGCATRPMALRSQADMHHARLNKRQGKGPATLNFLLSVMLGLMIGSAPGSGGGRTMPIHPGQDRSGGMLSASGHGARREAQARADQRHNDDGIAAGNATGRRCGLQKPARHLPGMLKISPRRSRWQETEAEVCERQDLKSALQEIWRSRHDSKETVSSSTTSIA